MARLLDVSLLALSAVLVTGPALAQPAAPGRPPQPLPTPWAVDDTTTRSLPNGCVYTLRLAGTVGGSAPAGLVTALSVGASVDCRTEATLLGGDDVVWMGPMSQQELAVSIEQRATVITDASGRTCTYVPDVTLDRGGLILRDVRTTCRRG